MAVVFLYSQSQSVPELVVYLPRKDYPVYLVDSLLLSPLELFCDLLKEDFNIRLHNCMTISGSPVKKPTFLLTDRHIGSFVNFAQKIILDVTYILQSYMFPLSLYSKNSPQFLAYHVVQWPSYKHLCFHFRWQADGEWQNVEWIVL